MPEESQCRQPGEEGLLVYEFRASGLELYNNQKKNNNPQPTHNKNIITHCCCCLNKPSPEPLAKGVLSSLGMGGKGGRGKQRSLCRAPSLPVSEGHPSPHARSPPLPPLPTRLTGRQKVAVGRGGPARSSLLTGSEHRHPAVCLQDSSFPYSNSARQPAKPGTANMRPGYE